MTAAVLDRAQFSAIYHTVAQYKPVPQIAACRSSSFPNAGAAVAELQCFLVQLQSPARLLDFQSCCCRTPSVVCAMPDAAAAVERAHPTSTRMSPPPAHLAVTT